ncbi:MAG: hypothetical protein AB7F86_14120 [Bdellovibrionales bacterium]
MKLAFSTPSKTFLVGEYAVLTGAPGLVLNTEPRFELMASRGETHLDIFHPNSAAGLWIEQRRPLLEGWRLEFHDPHQRQGGFGASSAQFIAVHCLTTYLQSSFAKITEVLDYQALWRDHQALTQNRGSGADVLAQLTGDVAYVNVASLETSCRPWPYQEMGFGIVRTHQKIATHEHLMQVDRAAMSLLNRPALAAVEAFGSASSEVFVGRLKQFTNSLKEFSLQAPAALTLIRLFEEQPWCLVAKGCGALGADTVLFLYPMEEKEKMHAFVRKQRLNLVATHSDLSRGLEMKLTFGERESESGI